MPRKSKKNDPYAQPDTSPMWRYAIVETFSPVYNDYVRHPGAITIKPGESLAEHCREVAKEMGTYADRVRLMVPCN